MQTRPPPYHDLLSVLNNRKHRLKCGENGRAGFLPSRPTSESKQIKRLLILSVLLREIKRSEHMDSHLQLIKRIVHFTASSQFIKAFLSIL